MNATASLGNSNGMGNSSGRSDMAQAFMELGQTVLGAVTNGRQATTQASKAVLSHVQGNGAVSDEDINHALQNAGFSGKVFNGGVLSRPDVKREMIQAASAAAEVVKRANIQGKPTQEQIADLTKQAMQNSEVRALTAQTKTRNVWNRLSVGSALVGGGVGGAALGGAAFLLKGAVETVKMFAGKGSVSAVLKSTLKYGSMGIAGGALLAAVPFGAAALSRARFNGKREKAMNEIVAKAVEHAVHGTMPQAAARGRVEPTLEQQQAPATAPGPGQVAGAAVAAATATATTVAATAPAKPVEQPAGSVASSATASTGAKESVVTEPSEPSPIILSTNIGAALEARKALNGIPRLGGVSGGETVASTPVASNIKPPEPPKDKATVIG